MNITQANSPKATKAHALIKALQQRFVSKLETVSQAVDDQQLFESLEWLRDEGKHGGGSRYGITDSQTFNRASVNVSQVHYDDDPEKSLGSATALSTIIHPQNPYAPSIHIHISWTELKAGKGYWRMMADLNPAIENAEDTAIFVNCLKQVAPEQYEAAAAQGDRYFNIPVLGRHRGVSHFYLEDYHSGNEQADIELAQSLVDSVIDCYSEILTKALQNHPSPKTEDYEQQRAYHTLYLFQVLTLDRGTTSGLLVHDQNDRGILGSLPGRIDKGLLASWQEKMEFPQDLLLEVILKALPTETPCLINDAIKQALAGAVRDHYQRYPQAISMQASGNVIPSTVDNHRSPAL